MNQRFCFVLLASTVACGSSEPGDDSQLPPHDILITENAASKGPNAFGPPNFTISLASQSTVTWLNRDFSGTGPYGGNGGITHRLISDDGTTFTSSNISPNGTFAATLSAPGSYGYHCSIHPAMTGIVTVNP